MKQIVCNADNVKKKPLLLKHTMHSVKFQQFSIQYDRSKIVPNKSLG